MAVTPLRVLLFVVGALVAAVGTAYFAGGLDPYLGRVQPNVADDGRAPASSGEVVEGDGAQEEAATPEAAGGESEAIAVPSFDIVRVEPDGSIVIAGAAEPGSQIEVVAGATVLGTTVAGPTGDFAVVLDEPLDPGDYQIVLRSTASENVAATSVETAIVSVPDDESGQVLALVEQPGQPSRLITKPEPKAEQDGSGEMASREPEGDDIIALQEPASEDAPETAMADTTEEPAETSPDTQAPASEDAPETAMAETAEEPVAEAPADTQASADEPAAETAATPEETAAPEEQAAGAAMQEDAEEQIAGSGEAQQAEERAAAAGEAEEAEGEMQMAARSEEPEQPQQPEQKPQPEETGSAIFIEAVEIDGRQVFVAGISDPGSRVRVYANDILLGEATTSPNGRFLVEATRDLPEGDYIVRADMLSDDGATVIARAAVPFAREAGERFSAVAPRTRERSSEEMQGEETAGAAREAPEAAAAGSGEEQQAPAAAADAGPPASDEGQQPAVADTGSPASDERRQPSVADTGPAASDEGQQPPVADAGSPASDEGEQPSVADTGSPASDEGQQPSVADAGPPASGAQTAGRSDTPAGDAGQDAPATPRESTANDQASQNVAAAFGDGETGGDVVTAPKLEPVEGAVIIRRGDTLWHISRRVYGRGIRYTTIYLANQDQIRDPDLIWPGQVFAVPETTDEGESADMGAIGDQAVPVPPGEEAEKAAE